MENSEIVSPTVHSDPVSNTVIKTTTINKIKEWASEQFRLIEKESKLSPYGTWWNLPSAFCNVGGFGEELCLCMYPDSIGSASKGGCAFDNCVYNKNKLVKAREVKFVSLDGSKECRKCSKKAPRFQPLCIHCRSTEFKLISDSRAGISAKSHVTYKHLISDYIIFISKYINNSNSIKLFAFKIDSKNEYFNIYIDKQYRDGIGNTCNFQPFSYDFHMSGPIKLFEIDLSINSYNIIYFNIFNNKPELIPYINWNTGRPIFTKKQLVELNMEKEDFGVGLDYNDNISKFKIGKKSHGKKRGIVTRV